MCIGGSFGGGNMFQANQSFAQFANVLARRFAGTAGAVAFGLAARVLVGLVIIGGIKRIGEVASLLVPVMCGLYVRVRPRDRRAARGGSCPRAFVTIVRAGLRAATRRAAASSAC